MLAVLAGLERAVEELEVPTDADGLAGAYALADRLAAKLAVATGAFEAAEGFAGDGSVSLTSWLRARGRLSGTEACRSARRARRVHQLPVVRQAWVDGVLSGDQVQAVVVNLADATVARFAEHEADLVPLLVPLAVAEVASAMQLWRARAEAELDAAERCQPRRSLHLSRTLDGRQELSGSFDAEGGAVLAAALRAASTTDVEGEPERRAAERRADALIDLCGRCLDDPEVPRNDRSRPQVNVVLSLEALERRGRGELVEGGVVERPAVGRLLCDAEVSRVLTRGRSAILDLGHASRTASPRQWLALVLRDRHCRFPGCDRPPAWCEAHHVQHWEDGGPTDLANLALLCSRHHHLCHTPGWSLVLRPDADVVVTSPSGRVLHSSPPALARDGPAMAGGP